MPLIANVLLTDPINQFKQLCPSLAVTDKNTSLKESNQERSKVWIAGSKGNPFHRRFAGAHERVLLHEQLDTHHIHRRWKTK